MYGFCDIVHEKGLQMFKTMFFIWGLTLVDVGMSGNIKEMVGVAILMLDNVIEKIIMRKNWLFNIYCFFISNKLR